MSDNGAWCATPLTDWLDLMQVAFKRFNDWAITRTGRKNSCYAGTCTSVAVGSAAKPTGTAVALLAQQRCCSITAYDIMIVLASTAIAAPYSVHLARYKCN